FDVHRAERLEVDKDLVPAALVPGEAIPARHVPLGIRGDELRQRSHISPAECVIGATDHPCIILRRHRSLPFLSHWPDQSTTGLPRTGRSPAFRHRIATGPE